MQKRIKLFLNEFHINFFRQTKHSPELNRKSHGWPSTEMLQGGQQTWTDLRKL